MYNQEQFRFGLEFEFQLARSADSHPVHHRELDFETLKSVVARSGAAVNDYMVIKYPGSSQRSTYLEGYDLIDGSGEFTSLDVKGVEISTPIAEDVLGQQEWLVTQFSDVQEHLSSVGLFGSAYGSHMTAYEYRGTRGGRTVLGWAAAETAMMTWGIHVNISFPDEIEDTLDRGLILANFERFGPALVVLSANTPIRGEGPWVHDGAPGVSERSYRRSFTRRPLYFRDDQHHRKEVTCFDLTPRLDLIRAYSSVCAGLMLNAGALDPQLESITDHNMREASAAGYDATFIDRHFQRTAAVALVDELLDRAEAGLESCSLDSSDLALLRTMHADRSVPADETLAAWHRAPSWPEFLNANRSLREGD